jgi:hypothetical protein
MGQEAQDLLVGGGIGLPVFPLTERQHRDQPVAHPQRHQQVPGFLLD